MFNLEQWLYGLITSDTLLKSLLASPNNTTPYNVYPSGVDIQPENFPAITFMDVGTTLNSTTHMHIGRMRIYIWSKIDFEEVMTIYTELANIINFQHSRITTTPFNGTLWWIREDITLDKPDTTRRIWNKMVSYKYWENTSTNT